MGKSIQKIRTGRLSLIMMIVFTILNSGAWLFGNTLVFPYSAYLPQLATLFAHISFETNGLNIAVFFWVLVSVGLTSVYWFAWKKSKTHANGFRTALFFFILDSLLFLLSYYTVITHWDILLTIAIRGLIIYHLFNADQSSRKYPNQIVSLRVNQT